MPQLIRREPKQVSIRKEVSDRIRSQQFKIGIANAWTIRTVFKPDSHGDYGSGGRRWFEASTATDSSRIDLGVQNFFGSPAWRLRVWDQGGTLRKDYALGLYSEEVWLDAVATWDGADLKLYVGGFSPGPFKVVDDAVTQSDEFARTVGIGNRNFSGSADVNSLSGIFHLCQVWNVALTADEIHEVYQGGVRFFDPKVNLGAYQSANNLKHFWLLGHDITRFGFDYADNADGFTFSNSVGMTKTDVRHENPYQ